MFNLQKVLGHSVQLQYCFQGDFDTLYHSFLDFKRFGELHPYMQKVELIDRLPDCMEYRIVEEVMLFGFIPNRPTYTARVFELEKGKHIRYTSQVKSFIFLTIDVSFSRSGNGQIVVEESMKLKCITPIALIFSGILRKAHFVFFENLKAQLGKPVQNATAA